MPALPEGKPQADQARPMEFFAAYPVSASVPTPHVGWDAAAWNDWISDAIVPSRLDSRRQMAARGRFYFCGACATPYFFAQRMRGCMYFPFCATVVMKGAFSLGSCWP